MNFRKEIFVEVAEAVHLGMQAITRFSQLEIVGEQLVGAFLQKSPVFAKAQLIAGIPTMKALSDLSVEMGHTFLKLGTERKPLLLLKRQIEEKNAVKQLYVRSQSAMVELMKHHNIEQIKDQARFDTIAGNFQFDTQEIQKLDMELAALSGELYGKNLDYLAICVEENRRINEYVAPALVAARDELGLSIAGDQYEAIVRGAQEKMSVYLEEFLERNRLQ